MMKKLDKLKKKLEKKYEIASKDCVKNAYDPETDDLNEDHFMYCEADVISRELVLLEKVEKILKNEKG